MSNFVFYKKIGFIFFILSLFLLGAIIYFVFYKVEIKITPVVEKVDKNFSFLVSSDKENLAEDEPILKGDVAEITLEKQEEFPVSHEEKVASGNFGTVTIINKTSFAQPLVATTRLLTADNILLRLKKRVTVPAKGEIEAEVYPDNKNFDKEISPTKMTIPGLSSRLQKDIYAENKDPIGFQSKAKVLAQSDIDVAREELSQQLYKDALAKLNKEERNKISFNLLGKMPKIRRVKEEEVLEERADKKIGEKTEKFQLYLQIRVRQVSFDENKVYKIAEDKLRLSLPDDKNFLGLDKGIFNYSLEKEQKGKEVRIKVYSAGMMAISENSIILDKERLFGKGFLEAKDILEKYPGIKQVDIYAPLGLLKRIPQNSKRIEIIIKNP